MSIAPTGSISNIVLGYEINGKNYIGVSGGVEPIFALSYTRRSESFNKRFKVFHATVQAYMDLMDIENNASEEETLPEFFFRTAHTVVPDKRVKIQGVIQKYIGHSISSTINLPEDVEPEVISDIYFMAWQKKLKGVTIYRDGSRFPILSVENELTPFQAYKDKKFEIVNEEGETIEVRGDHVLKNEYGGTLDTNSSWANGVENLIIYTNTTADNYDVYVCTHDHGTPNICLLYTSPSPRDLSTSRMPSSA